jgi:pectate lyase
LVGEEYASKILRSADSRLFADDERLDNLHRRQCCELRWGKLLKGSVLFVGVAALLTLSAGARYLVGGGREPERPTPAGMHPPTLGEVRAFPTAEGFGASSLGGRGGYVCEVTNLNNSGRGSFRACAEASGRRIVVFRTGGTITVRDDITVENPYLTVAGQTAPGGGITLRASARYTNGPIAIKTHDVVIRHIRFRPGPSRRPSPVRRGISLEGTVYRVVLDHVSVSWATDENVTLIDGVRDVTVQWSIISEGLQESSHADGAHSMGMLISYKQYDSRSTTQDISVHHNLFAHNNDRNPRSSSAGLVDAVNNVVYDYGVRGVNVSDSSGVIVPQNVVGNYFKAGPSTEDYAHGVDVSDMGAGAALFVDGNVEAHRSGNIQAESYVVHPADRQYIVTTRHPAPGVTTTSASQAYDDVLAGAGARVPVLDPVDRRIINEVKNGTGRIIDDPSEVGGWPNLAPGTPPPDSDHDGMPDDWELSHRLDPNDPSDGPALARNGYTHVENYLNELAGDFS